MEQDFSPAAKLLKRSASAAEVTLTIPYRGRTTESTYFVTANVLQRKSLFRVEKIARRFLEVLMDYRTQKKYLLHEFVVMPEHLHLIITPNEITLERAMQLIKGGFSFQINKNLKVKKEIWQPSFLDRRIRDSLEYQRFKDYIWQNPVKRFLARTPERISLQLGKPMLPNGSGTSAAEVDFFSSFAAGLKSCSTP